MFYCSREGFRKSKDEMQSEPVHSGRRKCKKNHSMWLPAIVAIKLTKESKYIITTFVEQHAHAFFSLNKHLVRSNREVGEKVKNTLFNLHST